MTYDTGRILKIIILPRYITQKIHSRDIFLKIKNSDISMQKKTFFETSISLFLCVT